MSMPTPRTDALTTDVLIEGRFHGMVHASLARQLERELAAARDEIATMKRYYIDPAELPARIAGLVPPRCSNCGEYMHRSDGCGFGHAEVHLEWLLRLDAAIDAEREKS